MTKFLFFSGKGGVGKTTMACTTAVADADAGRRVLIVTTDPASNLADVFEQPIGHAITAIAGVPGLWAMEIDPDKATAEYTDRTLAPIREIFPEQIVAVMEEQLAGPCTAEVAAFDRFADFLDPTAPALVPTSGDAFDLVIFDTAPTGHTVRLLELPEAWSKSISEAEAGAGQTCIGPAAAIAEAKVKYERALAALRDQDRTRFAFVLHPEATAIAETKRAGAELARLGIVTTELIVNGILPAEEASTPFFASRIAMQERYLAEIRQQLPVPTRQVPLLDGEVRGIARLRAMAPLLADATPPGRSSACRRTAPHGARTTRMPRSRPCGRRPVPGPSSSRAREASARRRSPVPPRSGRPARGTGRSSSPRTPRRTSARSWAKSSRPSPRPSRPSTASGRRASMRRRRRSPTPTGSSTTPSRAAAARSRSRRCARSSTPRAPRRWRRSTSSSSSPAATRST